jgi:hypothetical protein
MNEKIFLEKIKEPVGGKTNFLAIWTFSKILRNRFIYYILFFRSVTSTTRDKRAPRILV